jgi:peptidyl-prolyl cis-trans isomerase C
MRRSFFHSLLVCLAFSALVACSGSQAEADSQQADAAGQAAQAETEAAPPPPTQPSRAGQTESSAGTAATVNGTAIANSEVENAMASFLQSQGMPPAPPPDQAQQIRAMILDVLVGRELLFQRSVSEGIGPSQEEVDEVLKGMRGPFPTEEAWQAQLTAQGTTEAGLRSTVQRNLSIDKMIQRSVVEGVQVGDEEVKIYYDANPNEMQRPEEVRASHILLRVQSGATEEQKGPVRARAENILAEIKAGGEFAELARQHSEDPTSAVNGGDIGFFRRGMTDPSFEAAAFGLGLQKTSGIVESAFGYHIIMVTDRHEAGLVPFQEVSERLREFLKQRKSQEGVQGLVDSLKTNAEIELF